MQIKNIVLGIAIVILTLFVTINGISVFYPSIDYDDYCDEMLSGKLITTEGECIDEGGRWNPQEIVSPDREVDGYCDKTYGCRQDYEDAREARAKKVFYISIPLGVAILVVGGFLFHLEAVGAGLMGGGVGTMVYGSGAYWQYGDDLFRFIISLLGLAAVIYLAYWMNKRYGKRRH
ncbi:MAG: hypothetical protein ABIB79_04760 [archaeon]